MPPPRARQVEYVVYCLVAVALATLSSWLTVTFTRSTDFETRRDVVVNDKDGSASLLDAKPRKVMYYVRCPPLYPPLGGPDLLHASFAQAGGSGIRASESLFAVWRSLSRG